MIRVARTFGLKSARIGTILVQMIVKFTVSTRTAAYLRWLADNVLLVKSPHEAAHHLMRLSLAEMRRGGALSEPSGADLDQIGDQEADESA